MEVQSSKSFVGWRTLNSHHLPSLTNNCCGFRRNQVRTPPEKQKWENHKSVNLKSLGSVWDKDTVPWLIERNSTSFICNQTDITWSQACKACPAKKRTSPSGSSWSSNKHGRIVCSTTWRICKDKALQFKVTYLELAFIFGIRIQKNTFQTNQKDTTGL
jgi:hypothetical protein